jgi:lipoprotein-anchoring transpeptidase ErfK/SrfK
MLAKYGAVSALALAAAFSAEPAKAGMNDLVIAGVGPAGDLPAIQPYTSPRTPAAMRRTSSISAPMPPPGVVAQQPYDSPSADPRGIQVASSGRYGGGLIELMVTGRNPTSRSGVIYNQPPVYGAPVVQGYSQGYPQGYPVAPQPQQAYYAPGPVQASPVQRAMNPIYMRQEVDYSGPQSPGTIIVDTPQRFLFLVLGNGRALRYGIGVGRPGFEWSGMKTVTRKAEWPDWTPPPEMLKRRPDLPRFMKGGEENPLGARALYLGSSLYRIHGTNEPGTIGTNVSSGCIRMMNEDVIDLYGRAHVGTKVLVI